MNNYTRCVHHPGKVLTLVRHSFHSSLPPDYLTSVREAGRERREVLEAVLAGGSILPASSSLASLTASSAASRPGMQESILGKAEL